jgi:hypothetical protein
MEDTITRYILRWNNPPYYNKEKFVGAMMGYVEWENAIMFKSKEEAESTIRKTWYLIDKCEVYEVTMILKRL